MANLKRCNTTYKNNTGNDLYMAYLDLIRDNGPYAYSITITFRTSQNLIQCESQIKFFIKSINYKLFGRYLIKKKNASVHGVYVFEESSSYSNNAYHMHMLIRSDELTRNISYEEMESKFTMACDGIKLNCNDKPAIGERSIGLGYSNNCVDYILKSCKDQCEFDETLISFF